MKAVKCRLSAQHTPLRPQPHSAQACRCSALHTPIPALALHTSKTLPTDTAPDHNISIAHRCQRTAHKVQCIMPGHLLHDCHTAGRSEHPRNNRRHQPQQRHIEVAGNQNAACTATCTCTSTQKHTRQQVSSTYVRRQSEAPCQ
jgi:hypothetical protein